MSTRLCQIETNTHCNFRCWYCQRNQYRILPGQTMTMNNFNIILDVLSRTYARSCLDIITFAAYNEPMLDPFFIPRLQSLSSRGYRYWSFSNGSSLTEEIAEFLLKDKPLIYQFQFNIPSLDPSILAQQVNITFEQAVCAVDNIKRFLPQLAALGKVINICCHGNYDEKHHQSFSEILTFANQNNMKAELAYTTNRGGMLKGVGRKIDHGTDKLHCNNNFLSNIYIDIEGNLFLCCVDYFKESKYGNIFQNDFIDLFSGFYRAEVLLRFRNHFCRFCDEAQKVD